MCRISGEFPAVRPLICIGAYGQHSSRFDQASIPGETSMEALSQAGIPMPCHLELGPRLPEQRPGSVLSAATGLSRPLGEGNCIRNYQIPARAPFFGSDRPAQSPTHACLPPQTRINEQAWKQWAQSRLLWTTAPALPNGSATRPLRSSRMYLHTPGSWLSFLSAEEQTFREEATALHLHCLYGRALVEASPVAGPSYGRPWTCPMVGSGTCVTDPVRQA